MGKSVNIQLEILFYYYKGELESKINWYQAWLLRW
jgi:hypothetical protein